MNKSITSRCCVVFIFMLITLLKVNAQSSIVYGYDDNGNRTSRVLSTQKSAKIDFPVTEDKIKLQEKLTDEESSIKLYPNPTRGIIKLSLENYTDPISGEYRVYNLNGTLLKHSRIDAPSTEIDLSNIPNGVYVLRLLINRKPFDYKLVKQN